MGVTSSLAPKRGHAPSARSRPLPELSRELAARAAPARSCRRSLSAARPGPARLGSIRSLRPRFLQPFPLPSALPVPSVRSLRPSRSLRPAPLSISPSCSFRPVPFPQPFPFSHPYLFSLSPSCPLSPFSFPSALLAPSARSLFPQPVPSARSLFPQPFPFSHPYLSSLSPVSFPSALPAPSARSLFAQPGLISLSPSRSLIPVSLPSARSFIPLSLSPQSRSLSPSLSPQSRSLSPQPGLSPLSPALFPLNPALSPLNPALSPLNPPLSPLNPALSPLNPALSPLNPALSPPLSPLNPALSSLSPSPQGCSPLSFSRSLPAPLPSARLRPSHHELPLRQPLLQNLQTQEEHSGRFPPVRAAQTRRGHAGQRQPAPGRDAARGRGSQRVDRRQHRGFLQPDQHVVRHRHRVLQRGQLPRHVRGAQVRVPLGRRHQHQEAHQVLGAQVHRLPDDLGAGAAGRRDALPLQDRRALPQELPGRGQDHPEAAVPRLRPHLPPALRRRDAAAGGGAPQHLLQALHLLRAGVQPDRQARAGSSARAHREVGLQGQINPAGRPLLAAPFPLRAPGWAQGCSCPSLDSPPPEHARSCSVFGSALVFLVFFCTLAQSLKSSPCWGRRRSA